MLSVENLKVKFSVEPLFEGVSFVVNDKERVCLVGKNGAGKSTMLKIIAGLQQPTSGSVAMPQGSTVGYLPQVMQLADSCTLIQETEKAFAALKEKEQRLERINRELANRTDYESDDYARLIEQSTSLQELLHMGGGQSWRADMERTLMGLGFERTDFDRPTAEFSGGWRMRIELAKILLQRPDVLLLDEPTNHLDIESISWLEDFLIKESKASVILVSHDRAFLNNVCSRTLEISCGQLIDYKVKYDEFVKLRAERREQQLRAYENQQKEIADTKAFIERFRYKATKAVQVQSRIKQLAKIVPIKIDEVDNSTLHLRFNEPTRSGDFPLICEEVGKAYGSHRVFSGVNLTIRRGEKVAFVGRNGEGKSTLVKCIMGEIPYEGKLTVGHNVQIGYYAQNQAQLLDDSLTVYDTIDRVATGNVRLKIRELLGAFMFGGEQSDKRVKVLSGGERSRLAMLKLLLEPMNFLILDEPTNHLAMRTKDVLKEALLHFKGTVIVVSHDRDFLDGLVSRVYAFGGGKVREHLGGIYDYLNGEWKNGRMEEWKNEKMEERKSDFNPSIPQSFNGKNDYEQQKEQRKRVNKLEKQIKEAEQRIGELEAAIKVIESRMNTPEFACDLSMMEKHMSFSRQLSEAMDEWTAASEELETLNS
ncbi:MAG: ABC-F family ATP-binding cassette domain-containing protein [Bacteroidaceae bacterium]|nr:ABC-F family ATP-binding cassette domain-containing protein [Bacteroidaceae bacterium]